MASQGEWWHGGQSGRLSPKAQALAWALSTVSEKRNLNLTQQEIADSVTKVGGGHPTQRAISDLQGVFMRDPEWYPGKTLERRERPGPKPIFTKQRQQAVANAAMALKASGVEPTVGEIRQRCPVATRNDTTGEPLTDKYILQAIKSRCYDEGSDQPWERMYPVNKTALSPALISQRLSWAKAQERAGHPGHWYHRHCIWVDPCSTVLSDAPRAELDENMASYGKGKRWMSPDTRTRARNLRASPYATKQARFGDKRVWWFIVLTRGKVHFEVMPDTWQQEGEGIAAFVAMLPQILRSMLGDGVNLPRVICSDRGPGFYQSSTGHIVGAYHEAAKQHGFRPYAGSDASTQPPDIPDVLPHETAVAWARVCMKKHSLDKGKGIDAMEAQFKSCLRDCAAHVNANYAVDELCSSFPERVKEVVVAKGERLRH